MSNKPTRRDVLKQGIGAISLASGFPALLASQNALTAPEQPDLSEKAPALPVAIQRCETFEPKQVRQKLEHAFDMIGGIGNLVRGKTITVKINLTGVRWNPMFGLPPYESYQTHPDTAGALCAILNDAGAKKIIIVENLYWDQPIEKTLKESGWDIESIKSSGDHKVFFEDTRNLGQWKEYSLFKVPWGGFIFPAFYLNKRFEETDVLISLAKLKQHLIAGVTGAVKNFFGNAPTSLYGDNAPTENPLTHRAKLFHSGRRNVPEGVPDELEHGLPNKGRYRVPRITSDLFGVRPADLNIVDGIQSLSGGAGSWVKRNVELTKPKVLLVGKNGVCTDAVAAAVMGFNPQAEDMEIPFPGENHLRLLSSVGIGSSDLSKIEIVGLPLEKAVFPYPPLKQS